MPVPYERAYAEYRAAWRYANSISQQYSKESEQYAEAAEILRLAIQTLRTTLQGKK